MGDNYTCIAVANIYHAQWKVHIGLDEPLSFMPSLCGAGFCTIHLVLYCAPQWKHFRSTRPLAPIIADPELAQDHSAGMNGRAAETSANGAGVSESARSGGCFANGQALDELAQDDCDGLARVDKPQSVL